MECFEQSVVEGEIQSFTKEEAQEKVHAELCELVIGKKTGRDDDTQTALYSESLLKLKSHKMPFPFQSKILKVV